MTAETKVTDSHDSNVNAVCCKLQSRSIVGLRKYGVTTDRTDLTPAQWLQHLQDELMDGAVYAQKLFSVLDDLQSQLAAKEAEAAAMRSAILVRINASAVHCRADHLYCDLCDSVKGDAGRKLLEQLAASQQRVQELEKAGRLMQYCCLPPRDVSGSRMFDEASKVFDASQQLERNLEAETNKDQADFVAAMNQPSESEYVQELINEIEKGCEYIWTSGPEIRPKFAALRRHVAELQERAEKAERLLQPEPVTQRPLNEP